jgi:hypothetical protein
MANITVTAADVRPLPGAHVEKYDAGGSGNIGDAVYIAADGDVEQGDGDANTLSPYSIGIAVSAVSGATEGATSFSAGDTVEVVTFGRVTGFSGMTPGDVLYQSDTAGKVGDTAGSTTHRVGKARSATILFVNPTTEGSNS